MKLNKKGFTLIELVIVIIIIAILAAVAIPRFRDLARHAREASERATVTAVRQAITIYRAERELAGYTDVFPVQLDGEGTNTEASDDHPLFASIMEPGGAIVSGWTKTVDGTPPAPDEYRGPAGGVYHYYPEGAPENEGAFLRQ